MNNQNDTSRSARIYRVDIFTVPNAAREEFLTGFRRAHGLLRQQDGFVQEFMLEQPLSPEAKRFVTLVEWENQDANDKAGQAIAALHQEVNFDPMAFWQQAGIHADTGYYTSLED